MAVAGSLQKIYYTPWHMRYDEEYIVCMRSCIRPVLTFYVLREVFFIHQEMALAGGIRVPLGTCSSSFCSRGE